MRQHTAVPFHKLQQLWDGGKSYQVIGDKLGMKGKDKADPYKPVRATVSRLLKGGNGTGWEDPKTGERLFLEPRAGMRAIGVGKTVNAAKKKTVKVAAKKKAVKVVAKKAPKTALKTKKATKGQPVVFGMVADNKFLKIEVGRKTALLDVVTGNALMIDALHKQGYDVTQKIVPEVLATEPVTAVAPEVAAEVLAAEETATPANTVSSTTGPLEGVEPIPQHTAQTDVAA